MTWWFYWAAALPLIKRRATDRAIWINHTGSVARFTNGCSPTFQIRWKLRLAITPLLAIESQQVFAHATTAQLSCHVKNFVAITGLGEVRVKRYFHRIWIAMEKTVSETGPRRCCQTDGITYTNTDWLWSQHGQVITWPEQCGMKFLSIPIFQWEWIGNFMPHYVIDVITYPCWGKFNPCWLKGLQTGWFSCRTLGPVSISEKTSFRKIS